MKPLFRCTNISNVPCEWLKQYCHFHRQISAYAWKFSLSIMLEHIGIVRSLWVELNGSIKAVSPTYRCATYSHHESELPLCGRIDFTKPEKSSLIFINSIAKNLNFAFFLRIFDELFSGFRAKFQKIVTCVASSIKFAKTNQKFAENSEFCENYSLFFKIIHWCP